MIGNDLGDLRRSHYSVELSSLQEGTEVVVMGWVCLLYTSPSPRDRG